MRKCAYCLTEISTKEHRCTNPKCQQMFPESIETALPFGTILGYGLGVGGRLSRGYIVEKEIGRGGFAVTYRAKDIKNGSFVAIKELFQTDYVHRDTDQTTIRLNKPEFQKTFNKFKYLFLKETFIQNHLLICTESEHIPDVLDLFYENGTCYMVMEYIEGVNLQSYVRNNGGNLNFYAMRRLLNPVAEALQEIHDSGYLHLDIKPNNILIREEDGQPFIIDFGAAIETMQADEDYPGIMTPRYAAPEQHHHGELDEYTDVYGLAAAFYTCTTGKLVQKVSEREAYDDMEETILNDLEHLPEGKRQIILKALSFDPENRYQTVEDFMDALDHLFICEHCRDERHTYDNVLDYKDHILARHSHSSHRVGRRHSRGRIFHR